MYKIAILGCENSHAEGFLKIIQQDYPDIQVLGVHSEYPGEAEKLQEKFGVSHGKSLLLYNEVIFVRSTDNDGWSIPHNLAVQ